jgi:2-hydroxy-3-keto-5-methylthiopentenyl-1-phosphate phosphatase
MMRRTPARPVLDEGILGLDGTITQHDSCVHLLNRTACDSWRAVEDLWVTGAIGSRECRQRQWDLIPSRDEQELRRIVREVPLDPRLSALVQSLRTAGVAIVVLSDGYGFYAEEVCEAQELALISNHIDWQDWSVKFPAISASCECPGCGTCKPVAIRAAQSDGRTTVLVGDGASDRRSAAVADKVFAKDRPTFRWDVRRREQRPGPSMAHATEIRNVEHEIKHDQVDRHVTRSAPGDRGYESGADP